MRIDFKTGTFYLGDCFDVMAELEAGSVDMVLNDPPYGTTQNKWDAVIPFGPLWSHFWNLLKPNGAAVLTASQPFTSLLGVSAYDYLKYSWVWEKAAATGHLNAKIMPMKLHEDVLVFCRGKSTYNPQGLVPFNKTVRRGGNGGNFGKSGTENFQEVTNYPRSIIQFPNDPGGFHPTQKPVALFEYLIRTYSNPGELVLDNTAGSGTTAIAAMQSGRRWICIERDEGYFSQAIARVWDAETAL